ncbi:hypothetical protein D3C76_1190410 [compost metagenome]
MLGITGQEFGLQHVIDDERVEFFVTTGVVAVQLIAGGCGPAIAVDLVEIDLGIQVPEVLAGREHVIEAVFELVADRLLVALVTVHAGLTFKEVFRNALAVALMQGAVRRHAAVITAVGVVLQIGLQGQRRVVGKVDADGGGQCVAFLLVMVELSVGLVGKAGQPVRNTLVVIHRATGVKTHTLLALGADRGLNLMIGLVQRLLAGERYQAAR